MDRKRPGNKGRKMKELLKSAKMGKLRAGRKELIRHLDGFRITRQEVIKAKCYDCNGMGECGECDIAGCPLLPFSPYNRHKG